MPNWKQLSLLLAVQAAGLVAGTSPSCAGPALQVPSSSRTLTRDNKFIEQVTYTFTHSSSSPGGTSHAPHPTSSTLQKTLTTLTSTSTTSSTPTPTGLAKCQIIFKDDMVEKGENHDWMYKITFSGSPMKEDSFHDKIKKYTEDGGDLKAWTWKVLRARDYGTRHQMMLMMMDGPDGARMKMEIME